jgi:Tfp pilus assembly protein PilF
LIPTQPPFGLPAEACGAGRRSAPEAALPPWLALSLTLCTLACGRPAALGDAPQAAPFVAAALEREARGDPLGALSDLRAVLASHPDSLAAWRERARLAALSNQLEEALAAYSRILDAVPGDAEAADGLAQVALFVGDLQRAETAAARLCSLPVASAAQLALGARIAFERGDEQGCAERARAALLRAPQQPEAHFRLGLVALGRGELASARAAFEQALSADPGHAGANYALATWIAQQEPDEVSSAERFRERAALAQELAQASFRAAPALERLTRSELAAALNPEWSRAHLELARALLDLGRAAEADGALASALASRPPLREALLLRARAAEALGRPKQAHKWRQQWQALAE